LIFNLKKIANISLFAFCIALVLINSAGYFIYFKTETFKAKKQFKTKLRSIENLIELPKETKRIAIHKLDYKKLNFKEKYEFELNGNLYDIIKRKDKGDSLIYYVLADEDETQLFAAFGNHIKNEKKSEQHKISFNFEYLIVAKLNHNLIGTDLEHSDSYCYKRTILTETKIKHPPKSIS